MKKKNYTPGSLESEEPQPLGNTVINVLLIVAIVGCLIIAGVCLVAYLTIKIPHV